MGACQGRVPFTLHRELVDLVAQRAPWDAVEDGGPAGAELAALDVPQGCLELVLGVGSPATSGPRHGDATCRRLARHSRLRAVARAVRLRDSFSRKHSWF